MGLPFLRLPRRGDMMFMRGHETNTQTEVQALRDVIHARPPYPASSEVLFRAGVSAGASASESGPMACQGREPRLLLRAGSCEAGSSLAEVRGYQEALRWIHEDAASIPVNEETILRLHRHCKPGAWDAGAFKGEDGEIIEKHADGRTSLRFKPLAAVETPKAVCDLCSLSERLLREKEIPPLVVWAAQNLDFLCIHPFRDGNGRVSRILLLLSLYQLGFVAGKYISLERVIESSKERYYETLKASSRHWHAGSHDPWPYINYLLYTLKEVYALFAERFESAALPVGGKTEMVRRAVLGFRQSFHIAELVKQCPDVSMDMIRKVLKDMRQEELITCNGRGKQATWSLLGNG